MPIKVTVCIADTRSPLGSPLLKIRAVMSGYGNNQHLYSSMMRPSVIRRSEHDDHDHGDDIDHRMIPLDLDLNIDWATDPQLVTRGVQSDHYPSLVTKSDHYLEHSAPKRRKFHEVACSDPGQFSDSLLFSPAKVRHRKLSDSSSSSTSTNVANSPKVSIQGAIIN